MCVCVCERERERERERPGRVKSRIELERWKKERRPNIKLTWLAPIIISSAPPFHRNRPPGVCISLTHSLSLIHYFISCSKILRTYYVCFCSLVEF